MIQDRTIEIYYMIFQFYISGVLTFKTLKSLEKLCLTLSFNSMKAMNSFKTKCCLWAFFIFCEEEFKADFQLHKYKTS